jgi:competence protein ComEC
VLVPLLRAQGVGRLDLLVLSHRDSDHTGGAEAVLRTAGAHRVLSSLEAGHPLRALAPHQPCATGQRWRWDGVDFEVLHPDDPAAATRSNARSCVLRVAGQSGTALLAGDIEALQELRLVARVGERLGADVLLVPHHGSKTSSTPVFVQHVHPRWALVQAGYRNRFHHPAPSVVDTYAAQHVQLVRTDVCGAWHWSSADGSNRCVRHAERRYWHATAPGDLDEDDLATPDAVWP